MTDVGAILRSRTKDRSGNELGAFTPDTRPTDVQVLQLIDAAQQDLADMVGNDVATPFDDRARSVVALGAAVLVELTFFPEQVAMGRSPYAQLKAMYDQRVTRLQTAIQSGVGEEVAGEPLPVGSFPTDFGSPGPIISLQRPVW